jgi:hypothetical protein
MKIQKLMYLMPIFLTGCHYPVHGTLEVISPLTLKVHGHHTFEVAPGMHSMAMTRDAHHDKVELKMKVLDRAGRERKVKIHVPDSVTLPDYSGSFTLTSEQTGQPFDLTGNLDTVETDSDSHVNREYCGYGYGYYYGYYNQGIRLVTTHLHHRTANVTADFKATDRDETLANYKGSYTRTHEVIDAIGPCISP